MSRVTKHRGKWIADFRDAQGKRHREVCRTRKEADDLLAERNVDIKRGTYRPEAAKITFGKYAERWIAEKEQGVESGTIKLRPHTLQDYKAQIERYLLHPEFGFASRTLGAITPPSVKDFRAELVKRFLRPDEHDPNRPRLHPKGLISTRSINAVVTLLGGIFRDAVADGLAAYNPVSSIRKLSERPRTVGFLSAGEIEKLLSQAWEFDSGRYPRETFATMVHLAVMGGLRRSELLALRWRDIDLEQGRLSVRESYVKGRFQPCKTEKSARTLGIPAVTCDLLRKHRQRTESFDPNGLLFDRGGSKPVGLPFDPSTFSRRCTELLRAEGFPGGVTLHSLRHSYASLLLDAGADLYKVSQRLGHSNTNTTSSIYAHSLKDSVNAEADIIESAVFKSRREVGT